MHEKRKMNNDDDGQMLWYKTSKAGILSTIILNGTKRV